MDRGGIVVGWLVRLTAVLAVVGVVASDGISVAVTRMSAADEAERAAARAADAWARTGRGEQAYAAAVESARIADTEAVVPPDGFRVTPDGAVQVVVVRTAPTLLLSQVTATARWAVVSATGTAAPRR